MNLINGVSFEEYVAASAHLARGKTEEDIAKVLTLDLDEFLNTIQEWNNAFGELALSNPNIMDEFGETFANPYVGRFSIESSTCPKERLLEIIPNPEAYANLFFQVTTAELVGVSIHEVLEVNQLSLGDWATLGLIYKADLGLSELNPSASNYINESELLHERLMAMKNKWATYYGYKFE